LNHLSVIVNVQLISLRLFLGWFVYFLIVVVVSSRSLFTSSLARGRSGGFGSFGLSSFLGGRD
jgi:hypothetical protein